ncbi:hypothetical protein HDA40_001909 [Hamadaea flava]|uniref:PH domain-containing protein n=1 Tax=Hamadaea flava TaxID=1742688 RepID=A0ABV8LDR7_9ACTN|nr:hypothetical protein [Hamadaea flava]MCP2323402.1 hypothetical protein [Hamadaea flava]
MFPDLPSGDVWVAGYKIVDDALGLAPCGTLWVMAAWRRAEPVGISTVMALVFVIIGLGLAAVITIATVAGTGHWVVNPIVGILGIYGFLTLWTGLAWRLYRTGLYVSDEAVRVVYPWRNRVVAWNDIADITSEPAMLGGWATARNAIYLNLANGDRLETPVQRQTGRFTGGIRKNIGPVLGQADFDATLLFLREMRNYAKAGELPTSPRTDQAEQIG